MQRKRFRVVVLVAWCSLEKNFLRCAWFLPAMRCYEGRLLIWHWGSGVWICWMSFPNPLRPSHAPLGQSRQGSLETSDERCEGKRICFGDLRVRKNRKLALSTRSSTSKTKKDWRMMSAIGNQHPFPSLGSFQIISNGDPCHSGRPSRTAHGNTTHKALLTRTSTCDWSCFLRCLVWWSVIACHCASGRGCVFVHLCNEPNSSSSKINIDYQWFVVCAPFPVPNCVAYNMWLIHIGLRLGLLHEKAFKQQLFSASMIACRCFCSPHASAWCSPATLHKNHPQAKDAPCIDSDHVQWIHVEVWHMLVFCWTTDLQMKCRRLLE